MEIECALFARLPSFIYAKYIPPLIAKPFLLLVSVALALMKLVIANSRRSPR